jgi:undecaprenyl-diphosphatase
MLEALAAFDTHLFLFFNATLANPLFDVIFPAITNPYFWIVPALIAAFFFIRKERSKALIIIGLALITVGISDPVCNRVIKPAVHRMRPCNPNVHIDHARYLSGRKTSKSFPSSHAMNMFAEAMLFSLFYRKRALWFFTFAALIGFSRIYVGVHYPLDVAGGAIGGIIVGGLVYYMYSFSVKYFVKKRRQEHISNETTP